MNSSNNTYTTSTSPYHIYYSSSLLQFSTPFYHSTPRTCCSRRTWALHRSFAPLSRDRAAVLPSSTCRAHGATHELSSLDGYERSQLLFGFCSFPSTQTLADQLQRSLHALSLSPTKAKHKHARASPLPLSLPQKPSTSMPAPPRSLSLFHKSQAQACPRLPDLKRSDQIVTALLRSAEGPGPL